MEFRLYHTRNNYSIDDYLLLPKSEIVLSCDRNNLSGNIQTWWLGMWSNGTSEESVIKRMGCEFKSSDLTMIYRVEEIWGDEWRIWEGGSAPSWVPLNWVDANKFDPN